MFASDLIKEKMMKIHLKLTLSSRLDIKITMKVKTNKQTIKITLHLKLNKTQKQ